MFTIAVYQRAASPQVAFNINSTLLQHGMNIDNITAMLQQCCVCTALWSHAKKVGKKGFHDYKNWTSLVNFQLIYYLYNR